MTERVLVGRHPPLEHIFSVAGEKKNYLESLMSENEWEKQMQLAVTFRGYSACVCV